MPDTIIVALITGACAIIAQLIISYNTNQRMLSELEKRSEISDVKIEGQIDRMQGVWEVKLNSLTEAVQKHNGFAERIPVLEEKIKVMNNRLLDLERGVHHD